MNASGVGELAGDPGSLDFLRQAVEYSTNGIVFAGLDGRLSWANAAFLRMWGYSDPAEVHGLSARELVAAPAQIDQVLAVVLEKGAWVGELEARTRSGEALNVEAFGSLVRDGTGRRLGIMASVVDVTEKKRANDALRAANAALRESVERLNQAVRVAEIGIFNHDQVHDTVYWSPRLREIYGFGPDETVTLEGFFTTVFPEDRARIQADVASAHDPERGEKFDVEHRIVRRDGAVRWVVTRAQTFFEGPPGARWPVRTVGAVVDITDRKDGEAKRALLEAQLHQAQKLESVGRLAGGVAHDFNNMLAVILGYAELIKRRLPANSNAADDVAEIANAAARARELTRQLLGFSRKQIIDPRPVNLNAIVADTHKALARLIGEDIDLQFLPGGDLWTVKLDPSQVDQILMNLAVNARDAMPDGGKLIVDTANVRIDEVYCRQHSGFSPGDYVLLALSDSGVGMDAETRAHAFEPFFTTKGPGIGTGLGLATVYGIVAQNEGSIHIDSAPSHGTTLKLYFPRYIGDGVTAAVAEEAAPPPAHGTVLLVEDEAMVRKVTGAMLESLGFTVVAVASAAAAIDVAADPQARIDVLLTDVVMPGMSGETLRERVRAMRPSLPVLLMSGYAAGVIVQHGVLQEGVEFLQKPFSLRDLASKLHEVASPTQGVTRHAASRLLATSG